MTIAVGTRRDATTIVTTINPIVTLSARDYDAVLFDLDGVLSKTAEVHAAAWKRVFDGYLAQHAAQTGEVFIPFDMDADYRRYVDGKLREDGVASFLQSRGIELPLGDPQDSHGMRTMHALSKLKDQYFIEHLEQHGVETYAPAVHWCAPFEASRSRLRWFPPAITARRCYIRPVYPNCLTAG
jgi:hypothetical protein